MVLLPAPDGAENIITLLFIGEDVSIVGFIFQYFTKIINFAEFKTKVNDF